MSFSPPILLMRLPIRMDKAESERDAAWALNALHRVSWRRPARQGHCRLIHISTDYVFDGTSTQPYLIGDTPNPLNVYGASKLDGERAVLEVLPEQSAIVRTAWVYSAHVVISCIRCCV